MIANSILSIFDNPFLPARNFNYLSFSSFAATQHGYFLQQHSILGIAGKACISAFQGEKINNLLNLTII